MPEGPELHLASLFVNRMCEGVVFTGSVKKSEVSKSPDVPFTSESYRITAESRGKEVKLTLSPIKSDDVKHGVKAGHADQPMDIVFRFGMSGFFRFTAEDELPKHAHLCFYSNEKPCRVLSFVDARRFGGWQPNGTWQSDRGPCVMFEYENFRENVLTHLSDRAFDRPICETLLNQKYFNGIGNYLRAEILFRLNIQPFVKARTVLEGLLCQDEKTTNTEIPDQTVNKAKIEPPDLLCMCHKVPLEVVKQGGKGYDPEKADYSVFEAWLQCYCVDGMKSIRDHNGRTMWFKGDPGPMAPKNLKSPKAKKRVKREDNHDYATQKKGVTKAQKVKQETLTEKVKKEKSSEKPTGAKRQRIQTAREVSTPPLNKRASARRKSSSTDTALPRSGRVTRQQHKDYVMYRCEAPGRVLQSRCTEGRSQLEAGRTACQDWTSGPCHVVSEEISLTWFSVRRGGLKLDILPHSDDVREFHNFSIRSTPYTHFDILLCLDNSKHIANFMGG